MFTEHTRLIATIMVHNGAMQISKVSLETNLHLYQLEYLIVEELWEEGTINLFDYFFTIFYRVTIWLYILDSNFTYTGNDILRYFDGIKLWCNKKS
jgi:hypothetical protein